MTAAAGPTIAGVRAFYRGYPESRRRSNRVTRAHVIREDGSYYGREGMCGTSAGQHRASVPVVLDPMPVAAPEGLTWCPPCIGQLVGRLGRVDAVLALLAEAGSE